MQSVSLRSVLSERSALRVSSGRVTTGRHFARGVLALTLLIGALACSSTGGAKRQAAGGIADWTTYTSNGAITLRIVSDGWIEGLGLEGEDVAERRGAYFKQHPYVDPTTSGGGDSLAVKICDDEIFGGLVQALDLAEFNRFSQSGPPPARGGGAKGSIALNVRGAQSHFLGVRGMDKESATAFVTCQQVFSQIFNQLEGFQSGQDSFRFEERPRPLGSRPR